MIYWERLLACSRRKPRGIEDNRHSVVIVLNLAMDDEPKRPVAMCLTELNSYNEDDAMDHGLRPVFEADDMQVAYTVPERIEY